MDKNFQYKNETIHYRIEGSGQAVVLLHGFAETSKVWAEQVDFLKTFCQVITPDIPGSGSSGLLTGDDAGITDYAEAVNAVLENEKLESCTLLGHSMGGYITLAFAEKYAGKLNGFGLVHSTAFADTDEKKATREKGIRFIEEHGVYSFLKNTTPNLFAEEFKNEQAQQLASFIEENKNFSKEALIQYYRSMIKRPDRTGVLTNSKVPVLFVIGSEDKAAPLDDLLNQVHLPKTSYVHLIQNCGHMSMMEKPDQLNQYLEEFIKAV